MKKFYALAAAALAAVSMNAQLYVCGAGEGLGWDPAEPLTVEAADGVYTLELKACSQIKISTAMGDWDSFNAAAKWADVKADNVGEFIELVDGNGNILLPVEADWTVTVKEDLSAAKFYTEAEIEDKAPDMYVRGDMNGWGAEEAWQFTCSEDRTTYTFECAGDTKLLPGLGFKFADAKWAKLNYTFGELIFDEELDLMFNDSTNSSVAEEFEGTIIVKVNPEDYYNGATVLLSTEAGVSSVAAENAAAVYFNLQGVEVANPENGLYIVRKGNKTFKTLVK